MLKVIYRKCSKMLERCVSIKMEMDEAKLSFYSFMSSSTSSKGDFSQIYVINAHTHKERRKIKTIAFIS